MSQIEFENRKFKIRDVNVRNEGIKAISPDDYSLKVSSVLKSKTISAIESNFIAFENKSILLPDKFLPSPEFLDYHYQHIFRK